MDFGLSQDQVLLKDTIRRCLDEECPTTRVRAVMESESGHDPALWRGLAELGVAGLQVPPAHGGAGLELLDVALAAEELGWACTPGPFLGTRDGDGGARSQADDAEAQRALAAGASPRARRRHAWRSARTATSGTRRSSRRAPTAARCTARRRWCRPRRRRRRSSWRRRTTAGPGLWLVERGAPGLEVDGAPGHRHDPPRGARSTLDGTPAVEDRGAAAPRSTATRDAGLVLLAADAYGGARRCIDMTARYALTREQFGQPIGAFQAVKHQLADIVTDLEPALSLWWYAAHAFDHIRDRAERHAALAKAHLTDLFDRVTRVCTELHGGIGFTWEYDLHLWFRRAIFDRAFLGNAEYHRARAADLAGW